MSSSKTTQTLTTTTAICASTIAVALVGRYIKRQRSPKIHSKLQCPCGSVQGYIQCIHEDSIRLWCFCDDCREYAEFVASQGGTSVVGEYGETRLVQVCKSDLHLTQGRQWLQLSRKRPPTHGKSSVYMHRYYSKCCHAPLYQTVDFLGFVGVHLTVLDDHRSEFDGPVCMFPEKATEQCPHLPPDASIAHFLWKLIRYHFSRKLGPFDYDMEPVYWGKESQAKKH
jgi:hypothetical protein